MTRVVQWCSMYGRMMNLDAVTLSQNVPFSLSVLVVQHAVAHTVSIYGYARAVINESDAVEQTANDCTSRQQRTMHTPRDHHGFQFDRGEGTLTVVLRGSAPKGLGAVLISGGTWAVQTRTGQRHRAHCKREVEHGVALKTLGVQYGSPMFK